MTLTGGCINPAKWTRPSLSSLPIRNILKSPSPGRLQSKRQEASGWKLPTGDFTIVKSTVGDRRDENNVTVNKPIGRAFHADIPFLLLCRSIRASRFHRDRSAFASARGWCASIWEGFQLTARSASRGIWATLATRAARMSLEG